MGLPQACVIGEALPSIRASERMRPMLCSHGLPTTGADDAAMEAVHSFRDHLLQMSGGNDGILDAASAAPQCPLLQLYAAIFWLYAQTRAGNIEAEEWIQRAEKNIAGANDREKSLLEACRRWQVNDPEGAIDLLEEITEKYPRDTVAAKACEFNYYLTGQHFQAERFLGHMERLIDANATDPDLQAMYAFAQELSGHYDKARQHGEKAVELRFATPWAHHALSHIALVTGDLDRGLREQADFLPTWDNPGPSIHGHNAWHLACLRLQAGDPAGCRDLYNSHVWGHMPASKGEQADAISLLWRMEIQDETVPAARWETIAQACEATDDEALNPFVTAHRGYALARAGRTTELETLQSAVENASSQGTDLRRGVWREAGLPAFNGSVAAGRDDPAGVVDALLPAVCEIPRIGGSDAQGDLWREALADALAKLGRDADRRKVLKLLSGTRDIL